MQHEGQGEELAIAMTNKDEEDAKIVWILSDSYNKNKWVQGRVEIRPPDDPNLEYRVCAKVFLLLFSNATTAKCNFPLFLQIIALARRGNNEQSFVAIDQFEFLQSDTCDFEPKEAWPTTVAPPTTSTTEKKPEHWLECTFQEDLCGWELSGAIDQDMFYWNRTNGEELEQNELLGPIFDHNEERNGEKLSFLAATLIFAHF